jgi:glycosyltransferase 2 family protein
MAGRWRRVLSWALALAALAFVAWAVPVRDRCWDPRAPKSTHVAVTRGAAGCLLHLASGDVRVDAAACSQLKCEPGVVSTLSRARRGVILALLGVYAMATLAWAARWRALLGFAGVDLRLTEVWRISIEAQAGGVLLPGGIGGDALRIASVVARPTRAGEGRSPVAIVVASVLLDRGLGLSFIAGLAAILGFAWGGANAGSLVVALAAIPVGFVAALLLLRHAPFHRVRSLTEGRAGRLIGPVLDYARDPRAPGAIARAALWSVVVAASQLFVIRGLIVALDAVPTQEKWVYVGTTMAFIVSAVPALPGALGTADAAYVYFFGLAGIAASAALGVCLMFRIFWYISGVVGAILYVARTRTSAGRAAAIPPSTEP